MVLAAEYSGFDGPPEQSAVIPLRNGTLFPREGGGPDWAPAFEGEQCGGSDCVGQRVYVRLG
jgi:hypothetical protein